jgi:hypothetical protein
VRSWPGEGIAGDLDDLVAFEDAVSGLAGGGKFDPTHDFTFSISLSAPTGRAP